MPSATINPGTSPVTLINVFTVEPGKQGELVQILSEATEKAMKRLPGFVSANIHKCLDGARLGELRAMAIEKRLPGDAEGS